MRIARYWSEAAAGPRYAVIEGDVLHDIEGEPFTGLKRTGSQAPLSGAKLLAPCTPTKVVAGGANYHGHVKEVGLAMPKYPVFFVKPPGTVIGHGAPIECPPESEQVEYEAELAIVVKSTMRRTPPERVRENVLGFCCVNDVTARDIQNCGGNMLHLSHSKAFDTFCPTGPWIETDIDPNSVGMELTVNGQTRQKTHTSDMIFTIEEMVSYFSHVMTLLPGDLVLTGTPSGIGRIKPGDTVEVTIEGIGTLSNPVVQGG